MQLFVARDRDLVKSAWLELYPFQQACPERIVATCRGQLAEPRPPWQLVAMR
jgi:hypothetical protein